jgi:ABC-type multidrug transport system fused ATPase/permease subunit
MHTLSMRLLAVYLHQPYVYFLNRNTAELGKLVLAEATKVTKGVILPLLHIFADGLVALAVLALIVVVDPVISLVVAIGLGGAYGGIYYLSRSYLSRIGKDRLHAESKRYVLANEALSGIKELQLMGRERAYLQRYREPSQRYAHNQAAFKLVSAMPRYGIEAIAFGGVLAVVLYLVNREGSLMDALPLIVLYAMATYKLLPAFQQIYQNASEIRFSYAGLESLYNDLTANEGRPRGKPGKPSEAREERIGGPIQLDNVSFRYPGSERYAAKGLSLEIPEGSSAAFVGRTGAGKSTTVDLIMGLLEPTSGRILIDGRRLDDRKLRAWQRNIGYVPQVIYLSDDTVTSNIAFGIAPEKIDQEAVKRAARIAHIHDFISELPKNYDALIGDRGIRLSGGERQRLAIARALYHDPNLVVFDEATSALDNSTEAAVMEAIDELRGSRTVIMIAHRLSTVKACDRIFVLEHGRLVENGSWAELAERGQVFRQLASINQ